MVAKEHIRPERPQPEDLDDDGEMILIPDDVWGLIEQCWKTDQADRPTADTVCQSLVKIIEQSRVAAGALTNFAHSPSVVTQPSLTQTVVLSPRDDRDVEHETIRMPAGIPTSGLRSHPQTAAQGNCTPKPSSILDRHHSQPIGPVRSEGAR